MDTWTSLRSRTLREDDASLVLNKPAGISVMGERHETDLVELAAAAGEQLYPAHRIDKVTSGVVLFAKDLPSHGDLTRQFNKRTVDKAYLAITRSTGLPAEGVIDLPLSVGRKSRVRIAAPREHITLDETTGLWSVAPEDVLANAKSYPSITRYTRLWADDQHTLLMLRPVTGRRHQIRVHLAWTGHPIDGDPLFDKTTTTRTCLHAWRLAFDAEWLGGQRIEVEAAPDDDFWAPIRNRLPDPTAILAAHRGKAPGR
ncbi:MAG: RNA pseudouridine synthase [Actinomycetota bacterium]|nr:RNA pseudouridine synthase [Actinomycetota bacterium]